MPDTIRVLSRVSASFSLPGGGHFDIDPAKRYLLVDAPAAIRRDPLFAWLVKDGSLEISSVTADASALENDPDLGVTAEGKKPRRKPARKNTEGGVSDPDAGGVSAAEFADEGEESAGPTEL